MQNDFLFKICLVDLDDFGTKSKIIFSRLWNWFGPSFIFKFFKKILKSAKKCKQKYRKTHNRGPDRLGLLFFIILYYSLLFFIIRCYSLLFFIILIIGGDNSIDFVIFLDILALFYVSFCTKTGDHMMPCLFFKFLKNIKKW